MASEEFEVALSWRDEALAFLTEPERTLSTRVRLAEGGDAFGLLEADGRGWTLCIPDGADARIEVDEQLLDVSDLSVDASGERRVPLQSGLTAEVRMGEFRFRVRPAA